MKAIRIHSYGSADQLQMEDVPQPSVRDNEVLVKISYAGINPVDWKIREGHMKDRMPAEFPFTIGQDFSGSVVKTGNAVQGFKEADEVFGFAPGSYAEYAAVRPSDIALKPASMDLMDAAAIPTAGLTAWQALFDYARVTAGHRILIHAAGGGVGSLAVQLAKWKQASVIATASGDDIAYVKRLGADEVIDYKAERFEAKVHDVDAVIDLVGGDTLARSYAVVRNGGAIVSTIGPINEFEAGKRNLHATAMVMQRNAAGLAQLAHLVNQGELKPRMDQVLLLVDAKKAQELSQKGKSHGKLLLRVA